MKKSFLPILKYLPTYTKADFRADLVAGLTVAVMLVPQGVAYAMLAGMPPIYGLYGALMPLLLYGILGTSRQLSIGPVAISALLILAGITPLAEPGSEQYISLVILTGLLIGVFQLILSVLRMGFLVNFLSHPVIIGFTSAAAIIIMISQLKDILGFHIPRFSHTADTFLYAVKNLHQTHLLTLVICAGSIFLISILKKINKKIPGALLVVVLGTLLAWQFNLHEKGLNIIKDIPAGLPSFALPEWSLANIRAVLPVVFTVSIIGIVESISIAKMLEAKTQDHVVRPGQELLALGISKIGGAFFQALPTSGSFSRSAVNNDAGGRTGIASLVAASVVGLTLLFLTPLFYYLPKAVLAAIILMAVKSLFNIKEIIHIWKIHRQDFGMMLITFIGTLLLGIGEGVILGVVISILMLLYRTSKPHVAVLGQLPNTKSFRNVERFENTIQLKEILIIRFDEQLYFANVPYFKEQIKTFIRERADKPKVVLLEASSIHDMDSTGIHALEEIYNSLKKQNITFALSGAIGPVRDLLFKSGLMDKIGKENQFMALHRAVDYYQSENSENKNWSKIAIQNNIKT